jgi:hypothetical protein
MGTGKCDTRGMLDIIQHHELNGKSNNYFFMGVDNINGVLHDIPSTSIVTNYSNFISNSRMSNNQLHNVIVDLDKTPIEEVLNQSIELFNMPERILFRDIKDISMLQGLLKKVKKNIQYIFYNAGSLSDKDVRLFNDLIAYATCYINEIVLFAPDEDLVSYQTLNSGRLLDSSEHYNKFMVRK